jgi:molybdopterin converting factor small subunit
VRITLRSFGAVRELRGRALEELDVPDGSSAGSVRDSLGLPEGLRVAVAVNEVIVDGATLLSDGDELALLPPVGGG